MVKSEKLIGTTEYLTLRAMCRSNRCRHNRDRLYLEHRIICVKHERKHRIVSDRNNGFLFELRIIYDQTYTKNIMNLLQWQAVLLQWTSVTSCTIAMNFVLKLRQGNGTNRIWLRLWNKLLTMFKIRILHGKLRVVSSEKDISLSCRSWNYSLHIFIWYSN